MQGSEGIRDELIAGAAAFTQTAARVRREEDAGEGRGRGARQGMVATITGHRDTGRPRGRLNRPGLRPRARPRDRAA